MSSRIGARSVAPALFLVPPMLLGGCASIAGSTTQPVEVTAVCEGRVLANSHCTLTNDKGRWSVTTPGHTLIHKSYENLLVQCQNDKNTGHATFVSKNNGGAWGNILAGGLIGYAVDTGGGAGFDYPQAVTVVLNPPCPQGEQK